MRSTKTSRRGYRRLVLLLAFWPGLAPAAAQNSAQPGTASQPRPVRTRAHGPGGRHDMDGRFRGLFRAAPEDQGPLQPGEAEELLAFAQQHVPRVYELLADLQARDPEKYQERLTTYAPRLRHLRRIYERSPQMGALVQAYANDLALIEHRARDLRELRSGLPDSPVYIAELSELRRWVAANVDRECEALDWIADNLEARQAQEIESRLAALLTPVAESTNAPEELAALVASYRTANTDAERIAVEKEIRHAVAGKVAKEITALRVRAERLREDKPQEVERRVKQLLTAPGHHPR